MENCLVTGGAGFIGSHLVDALLASGARVRVLDDLRTGKRENLRHVEGRIEFIEGSVTSSESVRRAMDGIACVFHLAALPSVQRSVEDPVTTHEVCATGTLQVLNAARLAKVRRVVYAASSSAYGDTPGTIRRENDSTSPMSPYATAKLAGEHYCKSFTQVYGLETVRLRFFNIFGPRQNPFSPYSGVIPLFIAAMSDGKPPTIQGDGLQSRDFTYVENAVQAVQKASTAPAAVGKVYNIGNGGTVTLLELVAVLNDLLGATLQPVFGPPRKGDVRFSQADISAAQSDLGYSPKITFKEGVRRTLEAFLQEGKR
ncbi:MAG: SDR family oxidoreductase [Gemmataceae bacterium]|nr:SDR family oxidoreductase [Gemmataceae bacterium]MCI0743367.1 SDR family oxidoreductase [Gemmataceae bacterium]